MDPRIENLQSTTFCGRRFTRRQIAQVQETVATFPALARKELAQTICEHLFLLDRHERPLGCLLFSQATRSLACRDAWVGWREGEYKRHLQLVVGQPRFVLFPWVQVKNLASHALSLAVQQLPQDWHSRYGCRPVLLET